MRRATEGTLALLILYSLVQVALFYYRNGYLPQPYFFDTNDTFMDWFNVTIYAHNPGAYDQYDSVYPPLSFVVTRVLSVADCYRYDALYVRGCDYAFPWVFAAFFALNAGLVYAAYRRRGGYSALCRTVAVCFGLPMMFGIERGQLAILCFTFFVLAHGRIVRYAPVRWLAAAMTINFKPYLVLSLLPLLIKRRWLSFEGWCLASAAVYLVTYAIIGSGLPQEVLRNIQSFDELPTIIKFDNMFYQTSYKGVIDGLESTFPFMFFLGSRPIDLALLILPALIRLGQAATAACLLAALWRPNAIPTYRLTALAISASLTASLVGGYAQIFLLFLLFMERWRGVTIIAATIIGYLLCLSSEHHLLAIGRGVEVSYLSNQVVGYDVGVNLGELIRPGLILAIEYLLVAASVVDLVRSFRSSPGAPLSSDPAGGPRPLLGAPSAA